MGYDGGCGDIDCELCKADARAEGMNMKRLFIWESVDPVSHNYHDAGGLAIIADDLAAARAMLEFPDCDAHNEPPVFEAAIEASEDRMFVFPNAGCC